jgi:excisionase family DNA binding protein
MSRSSTPTPRERVRAAIEELADALLAEVAAQGTPTTPAFLSPAEFAQRTGLSRATVTRLLASGEVISTRPGPRRRLIPISEIDRLGGAPRS